MSRILQALNENDSVNNVESLKQELEQAKKGFDPNYEYSDDHSYWTAQKNKAQKIRSIEKQLKAAGENISEAKRTKKLKTKTKPEVTSASTEPKAPTVYKQVKDLLGQIDKRSKQRIIATLKKDLQLAESGHKMSVYEILCELQLEGKKPSKEIDYDDPKWDAMVKRVGQMAKEGPRKTVYDPDKRVYKTVPVNNPKEKGVVEGLNEMDKTQTSPGRDGDIDWTKKQIHLGPEHVIKAKDVAKHALKALDKTMKKSHADTSKKKGVAEGSQEDAKFTPRFEVRSRIERALEQYLDPEQVAGGHTDIQYYKHNGRVYVEVLFNYTNGQKIGPTQRKRFLVNKDFTLTPIKRQQGVAEGSTDTIYPNATVIKSKNGRPVGEIYQDENGWGFFHYGMDGGNDFIDSREDAIQGLKDFHAENRGRRPDYTIKGVAEAINPDITNPAFSHQQQIGDYLYVARYWSKGLKISAYDGNKQIGYAELMYQTAPFDDFADPKTTPKRVWLESEWTKVNPKYQRQGIMSTMYAYAKMLGNSVKPSELRSPEAKAAWASWRQSGDAKHLTSNEGVAEGSLEFNTPDPVVVVQDKNGKMLDKINLSVAAQKYKLGQPQNIKKQLAHQNYTTIGNYVIVSPMSGQPQDKTTQGFSEEQLDEINWKKAAATGALALGALGGLGASGSAQARVTPGADGQMSPSAAQQMAQQGFQASAEKSGGQAANQNLDTAEKVERGDNGIVVHYGGKEYKGMLVPKDGPTPRGAKMIKINQGQMGERGIGNYTTYLLPNGTAYIYKLASQSANEGVAEDQLDELKCWPGYTRVQGVPAGAPGSCKKKASESEHKCPHCGGEMVSEELMNEKKDACYYKVKSRYKVWPSAYASGALVKCRKKGASNWGTGGKKNESSILEGLEQVDENLHKWFKEKWVRFGPDGKIRGDCARGDDSEGKPKCLPQAKAHSLGKKGRKYAAAKKRREDPNPERRGPAKNVATKKKSNEGVAEGAEQQYLWHGSRQKIPMLEPRQSVDTGGAVGSNQNAIYATSDPKVAIAMGLTTPDSDTAMFPNDPQMVLFSGKIRRGENVYLHKLPFYGSDGKPQFVQGAHDREFYSIPGVKGIKPVEIKAVPVDQYLNLIRQATPHDLELQKQFSQKQGVAEGSNQLSELKKSTVRSYAGKKQAEIDDVPPLPFKKPAPSNAEHEKNAKGMMGALARLSGKKPTSEGISEVSDATKQSYKAKAQAQVKELEPHAKKGEYKDIAQRAIDRRTKGLSRLKQES